MLVLAWVVFAFLAAWIAADKGRSGAGFFFASILLSPLVGVIAALGCRARERQPQAVLYRVSPFFLWFLALTGCLVVYFWLTA